MEKFIYRFVTPEAILIARREKSILEKRTQGFRGPVGAIRLSVQDTIEAFLDYFDKLGSEGWIFNGMAEYPDLPYGGCYVFRKPDQIATVVRAETPKKTVQQQIDDEEITEEEYFKRQEDQERELVALDLSREKRAGNPDLLNAPAKVVNEILFRQQKVIDKYDPDTNSDVVDELVSAQNLSELTPQIEVPDKVVRQQLYQQYEQGYKNKRALHRGKETQGFKLWLDTQRAAFDPYYQEYKGETGELALKNEVETPAYKKWFKENKLKKDD